MASDIRWGLVVVDGLDVGQVDDGFQDHVGVLEPLL